MRIYERQPAPKLMRINITRQGMDTEFLTLCDCTQSEAYHYIRELLAAQGLSPFEEGLKTNIAIRESVDSENGKAVSVSIKGLEPKQVAVIIERDLKEKADAIANKEVVTSSTVN